MPLKTGGTRRQVRRAAKAAHPMYRIRTKIARSGLTTQRAVRVGDTEKHVKQLYDVPHKTKEGTLKMGRKTGDYGIKKAQRVVVTGKLKRKYRKEAPPIIYRNVRTLGPSHGRR